MGESRSDRSHAKQALLDAASEVFAADGYQKGTVARICKKAGANGAAVNYYFGSKEDLYLEVWRQAWREARRAHPLEPEEEGLSAELRLSWFMRSLLMRVFDQGPAGRFARIMAHEAMEPKGFLAEEKEAVLAEHYSVLDTLTTELLGSGASVQDLALCRLMVMTPSLGLAIRMFSRPRARMPLLTLGLDPEQFARRMSSFALAGIAELGRQARERGSTTDGAGGGTG